MNTVTEALNSKNTHAGTEEVRRVATSLDLPDTIRDDAISLYMRAERKGLIVNHTIECVAAVAIYTACRGRGVPRTLDEVCKVSSATKEKVGKTYRLMMPHLGLQMPPVLPAALVPRFCTKLKLSPGTHTKALEILAQLADKKGYSSRSPVGLAASAIYIASVLCGERRSQREIAQVVGVHEITIRDGWRTMAEKLDFNIIL